MFDIANNTPAREIEARIRRLQEELQALDLDAALILQNSDLFYYSGTIQQSHLYVPARGNPLLMVHKSLERARAESPLKTILSLDSPRSLPGLLAEHGLGMPARLGMELDVLPVNLFRYYERIFAKAAMIDVAPCIRELRAVKSEHEIEIITRAAALSDEVAAHAATLIQPGMTELELAGLVEAHARKLGHQGIVRMRRWSGEMFYGHLCSGASAAVPSFLASPTGGRGINPAVAQGAGFDEIRPHEPILLDYVFALNGYISDHTRIFSIGAVADDLQAAHDAMLDLQQRIRSAARPGVAGGYLYDLAVELAARAGYGENFMGVGPRRIRFIGHGVGIELDELPLLAKGQEAALQENMVIALEPKLIFPGKGVVGIENTHVVTEAGLKPLGRFPDAITVV